MVSTEGGLAGGALYVAPTATYIMRVDRARFFSFDLTHASAHCELPERATVDTGAPHFYIYIDAGSGNLRDEDGVVQAVTSGDKLEVSLAVTAVGGKSWVIQSR